MWTPPQMHDILIMQFSQTPQTGFQYLPPRGGRDSFAHQTEEVVFEIPEHEDALIRDAVTR